MAWNEPGKRDPWKGRQESPDINDLLRRGREGLRRLFGGGNGNGGGGSGGSSHSGGFLIAVLALIVLWSRSAASRWSTRARSVSCFASASSTAS